MILGIDLGNFGVKTSEKIHFKSKISNQGLFNNEDEIKVILDNKAYYLGEGTFNTEYNKVKKDNIIPLLYAAIALSTKDITNQVVMGLPIEQFKRNKDTLMDIVMENKMKTININGVERNIIIEDVKIAPEGASAFYNLNEEVKAKIGDQPLIIVDIGGRTTDICVFELKNGIRKITKYKTLPCGMLNIYNEIVSYINEEHTESFTLDFGEEVLKTKSLFLNGKNQDCSFITPILKSSFDNIFSELQINFKCNTGFLLLTGGGSNHFYKAFTNRLDNVLISDNSFFDNAIAFKKVGEEAWL